MKQHKQNLAATGRTVEHFFVGNDEAFSAGFIASARSFGRENAFFYPPSIGGGVWARF